MTRIMVQKDYDFTKGTPMYITVFVAPPYRETIKLHTFHKRRRIWVRVGYNFAPTTSYRRTRQIERFCQIAGVKCKVTHSEIPSA